MRRFPKLPARSITAALLLVTAACASTPGVPLKVAGMPAQPPPQGERDKALGEVVLTMGGGARGVTWGAWRIFGGAVDLTYTGNDTWTGQLLGRAVQLKFSEGKLQGAGVNLTLLEEGQDVTLGGTVFQRIVRITMSPDSIHGKMASAAPGFELRREGQGKWSGSWGPGGMIFVNMKGAAEQYPEVRGAPQFHLIMLGLFL